MGGIGCERRSKASSSSSSRGRCVRCLPLHHDYHSSDCRPFARQGEEYRFDDRTQRFVFPQSARTRSRQALSSAVDACTAPR